MWFKRLSPHGRFKRKEVDASWFVVFSVFNDDEARRLLLVHVHLLVFSFGQRDYYGCFGHAHHADVGCGSKPAMGQNL